MPQVQKISREVVIDPSETTRRAPSNKEIEAYLQGALHDASFNKQKRFRFTQNDRRWLELLQRLLLLLGYRAWIYKEGRDRNVYALETLASFLDFDCDPLGLRSTRERIAYLRGFFDAEGGIPRKEDARFYIQLVQKDRSKIECLKQILTSMDIQTGKIHNPSVRVDPEYWRMFVATRSHWKFARMIGSWHPRKALIFERRMEI
ncbi:MAG: LAGLIDADG family homing endonuclease [Candidatus Paceibacterota bacterium]